MLRHVANLPDGQGPGSPGLSRAALARRARASTTARDLRYPWVAYPERNALPREVESHLRAALNAAAERSAATEARVQRMVAEVEESLARDAAAGCQEATDCAAALRRLLTAARDATDSPSEATVKQLVCPRLPVCSR